MQLHRITALLLVLVFSFAGIASGQGLSQTDIISTTNAYRFYTDVDTNSIQVPTVVEIPFSDEFIERYGFAILDTTKRIFEPHYFKQETLVNEIPTSVTTKPMVTGVYKMIDKQNTTYANFVLPENTQGKVQIILSSAEPITSSKLTTVLDNNVALPTSVEIRALVNGRDQIVVATKKMNQPTITFPKTTSNRWSITFSYGQPLRISELKLYQDNATQSRASFVRFLAQPNHTYRIYFDPDRLVKAPVGESGNLARAQDVLTVSVGSKRSNPDYIIADTDSDGFPDINDNCIDISNIEQQDLDNNGRGDACDDFDQDGIINIKDNCRDYPNRNQKDVDSDGIGDACDSTESRITEQYPWLPWVGMGSAAIVLVVLLIITARSTFVKNQNY